MSEDPTGLAALIETPPRTTSLRPATWPELNPTAVIGLAGRIVETIAPHSEADPVAILLHTLAAVGNLIGPGPHARVEEDAHPGRLFVVPVSESWNHGLSLLSGREWPREAKFQGIGAELPGSYRPARSPTQRMPLGRLRCALPALALLLNVVPLPSPRICPSTR